MWGLKRSKNKYINYCKKLQFTRRTLTESEIGQCLKKGLPGVKEKFSLTKHLPP